VAEHWFEPVADHLGSAYLRYSFTKGTDAEVAFLVDELGIGAGSRVLDVGCGPGRHALALAAQGVEVVGIDVSATFVDLARQAALDRGIAERASFVRADARALAFEGEFDAAYSLCQGAFGLLGGPASSGGQPDDLSVLAGMARALRRGGALAVSAFSAYFVVQHLADAAPEDARDGGPASVFDASSGTNHEVTEIRDPDGNPRLVDLWTTCFTPRELRLLASAAGLRDERVYSVTPGRYGREAPNLSNEEFLLVARR
jgi:SAM-dependent methyltransferase